MKRAALAPREGNGTLADHFDKCFCRSSSFSAVSRLVVNVVMATSNCRRPADLQTLSLIYESHRQCGFRRRKNSTSITHAFLCSWPVPFSSRNFSLKADSIVVGTYCKTKQVPDDPLTDYQISKMALHDPSSSREKLQSLGHISPSRMYQVKQNISPGPPRSSAPVFGKTLIRSRCVCR